MNLKPILISAAILLSTSAFAITKEDAHTFCKSNQTLAMKIMEARQLELDMSIIMETVKDNNLGITFVQEAYDSPAYSLEENQDKAVRAFGNKIYSECFKVMKKRIK